MPILAVCDDDGRSDDEQRTVDTPLRQVLMAMTTERGLPAKPPYEHHLLVRRIGGSLWITCDSTLTLSVDDLQGEQVVVLGQDGLFPIAGRPFAVLPPVTAIQLNDLVVRANQLAEIQGEPAGAIGGVAPRLEGGEWYFADTGHPLFGGPVPLVALAEPESVVTREGSGIPHHHDVDGARRWTFIEHVMPAAYSQWVSEKREGAGRDTRLSGLHVSKGSPPLFREAYDGFSKGVTPLVGVFEGPSACEEVLRQVSESGLELQGYSRALITETGITAKGHVAVELKILLHALHLMACYDRLNVTNLAVAEHISRRVLQLLEASARNARQPDFEHLEGYVLHMAEPGSTVRAGKFASHIASRQQVHGLIMKQQRLAREEEESLNKKKKKGKGEGKDKDADG